VAWNVTETGQFAEIPSKWWKWGWWPNVKREELAAVMADDVRSTLTQAKDASMTMVGRPKSFQNQYVLKLFQKDIMTGMNELLMEAELAKEAEPGTPLSWSLHVMAWTMLVTVIGGMLFYVFLFGVRQNMYQQRAWTQSFAMWLVMEILLISTLLTLLTDVWVPMMLIDGVKKCRDLVLETAADLSVALKDTIESSRKHCFNAAEYFFVSHRVACKFPELLSSQVVLQYHTPWPKQSYGRVTNGRDNGYLSLVARIPDVFVWITMLMLSLFTRTPQQVQSAVLEITVSAGVVAVVGLHVWLFGIYPLLVVLPGIVIIALVVGVKWYGRRTPSVVPETVMVTNDGPKLNLVDLENGHVGRRASIQAGIALLQGAQNGVKVDTGDSDVEFESIDEDNCAEFSADDEACSEWAGSSDTSDSSDSSQFSFDSTSFACIESCDKSISE
jgi:hypothetical protein